MTGLNPAVVHGNLKGVCLHTYTGITITQWCIFFRTMFLLMRVGWHACVTLV
jgi:hypothetical protein